MAIVDSRTIKFFIETSLFSADDAVGMLQEASFLKKLFSKIKGKNKSTSTGPLKGGEDSEEYIRSLDVTRQTLAVLGVLEALLVRLVVKGQGQVYKFVQANVQRNFTYYQKSLERLTLGTLGEDRKLSSYRSSRNRSSYKPTSRTRQKTNRTNRDDWDNDWEDDERPQQRPRKSQSQGTSKGLSRKMLQGLMQPPFTALIFAPQSPANVVDALNLVRGQFDYVFKTYVEPGKKVQGAFSFLNYIEDYQPGMEKNIKAADFRKILSSASQPTYNNGRISGVSVIIANYLLVNLEDSLKMLEVA